MPEPQRNTPPPDVDLGICQTCGRSWREHEDCKTPSDCAWVRFSKLAALQYVHSKGELPDARRPD